MCWEAVNSHGEVSVVEQEAVLRSHGTPNNAHNLAVVLHHVKHFAGSRRRAVGKQLDKEWHVIDLFKMPTNF